MAPSILTNLGCAGGAAVITVTFIHPIDTVKTRLQVSGTGNARNYAELGLAGTCSTIAKEEGIAAFWKGIPAAWMREASYTSFRLGLYAPLKKAFGADKPESGVITLDGEKIDGERNPDTGVLTIRVPTRPVERGHRVQLEALELTAPAGPRAQPPSSTTVTLRPVAPG